MFNYFRKETIEIETIEVNMNKLSNEASNSDPSNEGSNKMTDPKDISETKLEKNLMKAFCLSIAYSASIGGCGSLVGSQPNLILKGYFDQNYPDTGLNFLTYIAYFLPNAIIMVFFSWLVLCLLWLPKK
jgi:solute carrier family 13 (sodium-dependent dicarboxylate transporter), member 2/3/5